MKTCTKCGHEAADAQGECLICGAPIADAKRNILDVWRSLNVAAVETRDPVTLFLFCLLKNVPQHQVADAINEAEAALLRARAAAVTMRPASFAVYCLELAEKLKALK